MGHGVRGDTVEGQSAIWPVQIHSYSLGIRSGGWVKNMILFIIVAGKVTVLFFEEHTPRPVIGSQLTICCLSPPANTFICHSYVTIPNQICLPVMPFGQRRSTQHLWHFLKSLWVIRMSVLHPPMLAFCFPQSVRKICLLCLGPSTFGILLKQLRFKPQLLILVQIEFIQSTVWICQSSREQLHS